MRVHYVVYWNYGRVCKRFGAQYLLKIVKDSIKIRVDKLQL
jgi:hypothetical protein